MNDISQVWIVFDETPLLLDYRIIITCNVTGAAGGLGYTYPSRAPDTFQVFVRLNIYIFESTLLSNGEILNPVFFLFCPNLIKTKAMLQAPRLARKKLSWNIIV